MASPGCIVYMRSSSSRCMNLSGPHSTGWPPTMLYNSIGGHHKKLALMQVRKKICGILLMISEFSTARVSSQLLEKFSKNIKCIANTMGGGFCSFGRKTSQLTWMLFVKFFRVPRFTIVLTSMRIDLQDEAFFAVANFRKQPYLQYTMVGYMAPYRRLRVNILTWPQDGPNNLKVVLLLVSPFCKPWGRVRVCKSPYLVNKIRRSCE
jgi:hypothetical protein